MEYGYVIIEKKTKKLVFEEILDLRNAAVIKREFEEEDGIPLEVKRIWRTKLNGKDVIIPSETIEEAKLFLEINKLIGVFF